MIKYHIAYLLSACYALQCSDYENMVRAYKNNDLTGFVRGHVGGSIYYGPRGYEGPFDLPEVNGGLIFHDADITRMAISKPRGEACPGAYLYGKSRTNRHYSSFTGSTNSEMPSIVLDISNKGLRHVHSIIEDKDTGAKIWVKNNSLVLSYEDYSESVGLEAALDKYYSKDYKYNDDLDGTAWAASNQGPGWPGATINIGSFVTALLRTAGSKQTGRKVYTESGCFYKPDDDHHWQTDSDNCDQSALCQLFEIDGGSQCPSTTSCIYQRAIGKHTGSGNWKSTTTIGTSYSEVQQLNCDSYELKASEYSAMC